MDFLLSFFFLLPLFFAPSLSTNIMIQGSSLSVDRENNILTSSNGLFAAGFHAVGNNAFIFAVWFAKSTFWTPAWIANRDEPVNGRASKLSLLKTGNLVLRDAGKSILWSTSTSSPVTLQLRLHDNGNLVLSTNKDEGFVLWQSFDSPTSTLLPQQFLTRQTSLVSSRSRTNYSSGFYKLYFDNDNVLRLLYDGPEVSSTYWPDPWLIAWDAGRSTYNSSKIALLDSEGQFTSSDNTQINSSDFGSGPQRRLALDFDGNLRLYSLDEMTGNWAVTWQALLDPCRAHGICGPNSICSYSGSGRGCSCLPGYKMKNPIDWSNGCELEYDVSEGNITASFQSVSYVEFYGYEYDVFKNSTLEGCKARCLESTVCKGFLIKFEDGVYNCYAKSQMLNGKRSPNLLGTLYVKLNATRVRSVFVEKFSVGELGLNCSGIGIKELNRIYRTPKGNSFLKFLVWFCAGVGLVEVLSISFLLWFMFRTPKDSNPGRQGYHLVATRYRKFTYLELKKATKGFKEEIGRGAYGVVYKGKLPDSRVAAIKRLNVANRGEDEFLAELCLIGRLNHMNLIEMWGYCIEGKHRLLVYEYVEHGSLAENLSSNMLSWDKKFNIAVGTARGLAYLHEECLEWVLHCDVKPQNILLDSNFQPKVADFGLSKLVERGAGVNWSFSRIRGTRGYLAPEWVSKLPITSKVDVYSYGIVVLEMVTGRSPVVACSGYGDDEGDGSLVSWIKNKRHGCDSNVSWVEDVVDPSLNEEYDAGKMKTLIGVAMQCVEEDMGARPTMSQVVEMLLCCEDCYRNG